MHIPKKKRWAAEPYKKPYNWVAGLLPRLNRQMISTEYDIVQDQDSVDEEGVYTRPASIIVVYTSSLEKSFIL